MEYRLKVERREKTGKESAKKIRRAGKVPGVMYGGGEESIPIMVDYRELEMFIHRTKGESVPLNLEFDKDNEKMAIIKEIQRDPVTGKIIHVDFQILHKGEKIETSVPIVAIGEPIGVKMGGILEHILREVDIRALPSQLVPHIEVDVSDMRIGDVIHVKDLKVPEGIEILEDPEEPVFTVIAPKHAEITEEETEEAAPEEKPAEEKKEE